jgi:NAD(P)H dehydrogenase (quinone)
MNNGNLKTENMIFITGATGHYGGLVIDFLLKEGIEPAGITALARDNSKAESLVNKGIKVVTGDYDDYKSLVSAFAGTEKLLFISGSDVVKRGRQHENAVNAATETGIKHIIYTSFQRVNDSASSPIALLAKAHIDTEKHIKASGMEYTILKNTLYAEGLPAFYGEMAAETGIFFPAGKGKGAFALRSDMAEATAKILTQSGHENKEYLFSNIESVSFADVAEILSEIFRKKVIYTDPSVENYAGTMRKAGVPEPVIGIMTGFGEALIQGEFSATSKDLENLLGRKPVSVREFLTKLYTAKK